MFSSILNKLDKEKGLPDKIANSILNDVTDDVSMEIISWEKSKNGGYEIKVERTEYYEAMLPDPGEKTTEHTLYFDKAFKRIE
jgi:hypothetical protein